MNNLLSIGLWNVEWASRSDRGHFFVPRLAELSCDVLCVTEGNTDLFTESGHIITSDADYATLQRQVAAKFCSGVRNLGMKWTLSAHHYSRQVASWLARP